MNPNVLGAEVMQIVPAIMPVDLFTAANNGDWVSLKNYHRLTCVVLASAATGSPSADLTITLQQATDVSGTGAKALSVISRAHYKDAAALTAVGAYTEDTQTAASTYTRSGNGDRENLYVIDVLPEDLDVDNSFDCVRLNIAQLGSEKIGCAIYILWPPRYAAHPPLLPSAIID
jgi:hypothetical protein